MTPKEVKERVAACYAEQDDPESAHLLRDELFVAVLTEIANNSTDKKTRELATEALKTETPGFRMWFA